MAPTRNYPMCENSTRYNRTRNFGLYGHAESKKTQKFVFRSALRPNQISFSHGQDPERTFLHRIGKGLEPGSLSQKQIDLFGKPSSGGIVHRKR